MKRLESKYAPLHLVPLIERLGTPQVTPVVTLLLVRGHSRLAMAGLGVGTGRGGGRTGGFVRRMGPRPPYLSGIHSRTSSQGGWEVGTS